MNQFNEDYYEKGVQLNISGYSNFRWMPEMTIPMCDVIRVYLKICTGDKILDFGCAKGYMVKAFQEMGYMTYGVDISEYAIGHGDNSISKYLELYKDVDSLYDTMLRLGEFTWTISKDVMEHIPYKDIGIAVSILSKFTNNLFVIVPLADDNKYVVPEYEQDVTHIIRENKDWWIAMFEANGFELIEFNYRVPGIKDNWAHYEHGNGFFTLKAIR